MTISSQNNTDAKQLKLEALYTSIESLRTEFRNGGYCPDLLEEEILILREKIRLILADQGRSAATNIVLTARLKRHSPGSNPWVCNFSGSGQYFAMKESEKRVNTLKDKTVLIMGGTSGIGLAAARQLATRGASVVVTGRNRERADQVRKDNPTLRTEIVDASSPTDLSRFYASMANFDDLVLCVSGAKGAGPFISLDISELRSGFEEKFFAQFQAAQAALPFLRKDGSLTFISAISARMANPGTVGLAAINGAIESMVRPLARELRPLRVNAISPGVVETPWWDRLPQELRDSSLQQAAAASLVGRNGSAGELGSAIEFVVTNGFVTGTVLEIDGGLHLV